MNTLEAYNVSVDLIRELRALVPLIEQEDRELGIQIRRAASSVCLNLGEGARSLKGNKRKHYAIAHGSAGEVQAALTTAIAWGFIEEPREASRLLDRLLGLIWGLTHPKQQRHS
jgi:four helix bundle protein